MAAVSAKSAVRLLCVNSLGSLSRQRLGSLGQVTCQTLENISPEGKRFLYSTHRALSSNNNNSSSSSSSYKLVVVGGGAGGSATAAHFSRELGKGHVAVIEPSETHAYQSMWTLVGAGLKTLDQSQRPMSSVLPCHRCDWIKESAVNFDPQNNTLTTSSGKKIQYEYLVVATGLQLNYDKVKGLTEALQSDPMVCSNYHPGYVVKTYPALQGVERGNAIFTFPNTPVKCAGAPQKIMYLGEEIFRNGVRDKIDVIFNTSLPAIFAVEKYAATLRDIIRKRHITVNFRYNLIEVRPDTREAVFELLDSTSGETQTFKYSFLHATPPMSAPDVVRVSPLVNADGWVDVDRHTLQHTKFINVFAIGDCTNLPTSKTAAAAAAQYGVLKSNLSALMKGKQLARSYDGYTSCPLVTGKNKCVLAEFDYDCRPRETFPVDQSKERWSMYQMKAHVMPNIYFHGLVKGIYEGPAVIRKILHLGMGEKKTVKD